MGLILRLLLMPSHAQLRQQDVLAYLALQLCNGLGHVMHSTRQEVDPNKERLNSAKA